MSSAHWLQYVSCQNDEVGAESFDVGIMSFSQDEKKHVARWEKVSHAAIEAGAPTPYRAYDPNIQDESNQFFFISEAELPHYQEYMMVTPKKLVDYMEANRSRLRRIEVDETQVFRRSAESLGESFEPVSVFDIWLSGLENMKLTDSEDIAGEIDAELEKQSAGEVIGAGQTVGEDHHNIAVKNEPGKNKQALACIRRVLKRLKADPTTTEIWEQKADGEDHVGHALD